jgi:hypothetical protein
MAWHLVSNFTIPRPTARDNYGPGTGVPSVHATLPGATSWVISGSRAWPACRTSKTRIRIDPQSVSIK